MALIRAGWVEQMGGPGLSLTAEAVQGATLTFQSIDDIHSSDGLPLGVLSVGDGITDDIFKEHLEDTSGFFVDQTRDTFDTTSASKTTDGWLGDTLDVITQHLPVTLGASFAESLTTFASTRHIEFFFFVDERVFEKRRLQRNSLLIYGPGLAFVQYGGHRPTKSGRRMSQPMKKQLAVSTGMLLACRLTVSFSKSFFHLFCYATLGYKIKSFIAHTCRHRKDPRLSC